MSKTFKTMPQLLEENRRLLQDKKRLDWLEENAAGLNTAVVPPGPHVWVGKSTLFDVVHYSGPTYRAAIDAAMEATK